MFRVRVGLSSDKVRVKVKVASGLQLGRVRVRFRGMSIEFGPYNNRVI